MDAFSIDFFIIGKIIVGLLFVMFLFFVLYFIERCIYLHKGQINPQRFLDGVKSLIKNNRENEALTVCECAQGPIPLIVKTAIIKFKQSSLSADKFIKKTAILEIPLLEKRLNSIRVIAQTAPMLSFIGAISMFAKGIYDIQHNGRYFLFSEISTVLNWMLLLIIIGVSFNAIATIGYSFLYGRVKRITRDIEYAYNEIMSFLEEKTNDNR